MATRDTVETGDVVGIEVSGDRRDLWKEVAHHASPQHVILQLQLLVVAQHSCMVVCVSLSLLVCQSLASTILACTTANSQSLWLTFASFCVAFIIEYVLRAIWSLLPYLHLVLSRQGRRQVHTLQPAEDRWSTAFRDIDYRPQHHAWSQMGSALHAGNCVSCRQCCSGLMHRQSGTWK